MGLKKHDARLTRYEADMNRGAGKLKRLICVSLLLLAEGAVADSRAGEEAAIRGDYVTAFKEFQVLAEVGECRAQAAIGQFYYDGKGVSKDYSKAIAWFRRAAEQGHAGAQWMLGLMYKDGKGVSKDLTEAIRWLRMHAETSGSKREHYNLGVMYESGFNVPEDHAEAVKWYLYAAERGHALSQNSLGEMYMAGDGIPVDMVRAYAWLSLAAAHENSPAEDPRNTLAHQMSASQVDRAESLAATLLKPDFRVAFDALVNRDYTTAFRDLKFLAEAGHPEAQYWLGSAYISGDGLPRDLTQGVRWIRESATQGVADAQHFFGVLYANGVGVAQDLVHAYVWLSIAVSSDWEIEDETLASVREALSERQLIEAESLRSEISKQLPKCT